MTLEELVKGVGHGYDRCALYMWVTFLKINFFEELLLASCW